MKQSSRIGRFVNIYEETYHPAWSFPTGFTIEVQRPRGEERVARISNY